MRYNEPFPAERFFRARIFVNGVATGEVVEDFDSNLRFEYLRYVTVYYCAPMQIMRRDVHKPPLSKSRERCRGHHNDPKGTCGIYGRPNISNERLLGVYDIVVFAHHGGVDEFQLHFRGWR